MLVAIVTVAAGPFTDTKVGVPCPLCLTTVSPLGRLWAVRGFVTNISAVEACWGWNLLVVEVKIFEVRVLILPVEVAVDRGF